MDIEIRSSDVEKAVSTWEGKENVRYNQWALLSQGGFVLSFYISHQSEADALKPGFYDLDPTSFSSKQGRLSVERVKLKPRANRAPAAPKP